MKKFFIVFWTFFKIGIFTIGGGIAMIPLIQKEVVDNKGWIDDNEIADVFAVIQSVPGAIAINSSIFIGYKIGGVWYAVAAALGVILPSFMIILVLAPVLIKFKDNTYLQKAFTGVRAGVTALIAAAVFKIGKKAIQDKIGIIIAVISFMAIVFLDIHVVFIILSGGLFGFIFYRINKKDKDTSG